MKPSTIRGKLLLYTLLTIVISLGLVGILLESFSHRYFLDTAAQSAIQGREILRRQMDLLQDNLQKEILDTLSDKRVVASLSLIDGYQDPSDYNAILFDEEKKKIGYSLLKSIRTSEADEAHIFDSAGNLCAFVVLEGTDNSAYAMGIVTYAGGRQAITVMESTIDEIDTQNIFEHLNNRHRHNRLQSGYESHYHRNAKGLFLEQAKPVARKLPEGKHKMVGTVIFAKWINRNVFNSFGKPAAISYGIIDNAGGVILEMTEDQQISRSELQAGIAASDRHESIFETENSFILLKPEQLIDKTRFFIISAYPKEIYLQNRFHTRLTILLVMLVVTIIVTPLGMVLLRRWISQPMQQLMEGVESIRQGSYDQLLPLDSEGEFRDLANAMNTMVNEIKEREHDLTSIIENIPLMVYVKNTEDLRFTHVNQAFEAILGTSREACVGKSVIDLLPSHQAESFTQNDRMVIAGGQAHEIPEETVDTDIGQRILYTRKVPIYDINGKPRFLLGVSEDITEKKQAEEQLRLGAKVFESTSEGAIITDARLRILDVNHAFTRITGYTLDECRGKEPKFMQTDNLNDDLYNNVMVEITHNGSWRGDIRHRRKNGEIFPAWVTVSQVQDEAGKVTHYVSVFTDISTIKRKQDELDYLAHHDPLTKLPNRLLLNDRLQHAFDRAKRDNTKVAVMFLDLDRFKDINDSLGHPVGDQLLVAVAKRFQTKLRSEDTLARTGGDEFVFIAEGEQQLRNIVTIAGKILEVFHEPFNVINREMFITGSLGISLFPDDGDNVTALIRNADAAMYRAKEHGRNQFLFYTEDMTKSATHRMETDLALRDAVLRREFRLHYQPQHLLNSRQAIAFEALIRWQRPGHGLIMPDRFIFLCEENGLILQVGEWVLRSACDQMAEWLDKGLSIERIAVNISPLQIERGDLLKIVTSALDNSRIMPENLELEVTEAIFLQTSDTARDVLHALDELGVVLTLDDFGTGFSSLSYLQNFHFDRIKIDRSFIQNMLDNPNQLNIVKSMITLGHSLGMHVLAEGIETETQASLLRKLGCNEGQGFFFDKPLSPEKIASSLSAF
ncbi:MAG: EAL domain-containing protein [Candidatus Thiodiazotropha sp. (ex Epidulcina cf. delphinae)]|nr:EAL domain-containing protein [Candidatus Thiodiazotropha sp. (ex Epidulcina cf. delphinae)]